MRKIMSGVLALLWVAIAAPAVVQAGEGTTLYKPGVVENAIAKGETLLVDYKASW